MLRDGLECDAFRRRRVLCGTTTLVGALAGCLGGRIGDDSDDENGDDDSDDGTGDDEAGDGIPPAGVGDGKHRLYLANLDDETHRVELRVSDRFAAEAVVDGVYEVPAEAGAAFARIAGVEIRYDVTADVLDGGSATETWVASSCEETGGPTSQNAAVRIKPGGEELAFVEDHCDEVRAGTSVSFAPADEVYVEEARRSVTR